VKAAVGATYLALTQWRSSIGVQATSDVPRAFAERNVKAAYAELFVPILGDDTDLPFAKRLDLSLAVRTEDYSDVGSTTNPKVGINWDVVEGLRIRGAWSKSFRAPNLIENNPEFFSRVGLATISNLAGDPTIPPGNTATNTSNVLNVAGSNADLTPEKATSWSVGADFEPDFLPGFKAGLTYYNIEYRNQIIGLQTFGATYLASPGNRTLFAPYIVAAPQPTTCVNGDPATYNPLYLPALGRPTVTPVDQSNICSAQAITFTQNANAATVKQDGLDFLVNYRFETGSSRWSLSANATKILNNDLQIVAGGPFTDALDIINQPISFRGRAAITWTGGPLTVSPSVNHVGAYTNNLPITVNGVVNPVSRVRAWTTFDLLLALDFESLGSWGRRLRASMVVRNLFDAAPPVVLSANGNAFDPQGANPFGRIITFQLTKGF
jgi:iron complex outermembrane receptor protein